MIPRVTVTRSGSWRDAVRTLKINATSVKHDPAPNTRTTNRCPNTSAASSPTTDTTPENMYKVSQVHVRVQYMQLYFHSMHQLPGSSYRLICRWTRILRSETLSCIRHDTRLRQLESETASLTSYHCDNQISITWWYRYLQLTKRQNRPFYNKTRFQCK